MGFGYTKKDAKTLLISQYIIISFFIFAILIGFKNFITSQLTLMSLIWNLFLLVGIVVISISYILKRDRIIPNVKCKIILLWSKGKFKQAEEMTDKKIDSNFLGFRHHWMDIKAMIMIKKRKLDEAEKILDELEKKLPNFRSMWYSKACLESIKGNSRESLRCLVKSLQILEKYKKSVKSPFSKLFAQNWVPNVISYAKKDEDLSELRKSEEFWNFVNQFE